MDKGARKVPAARTRPIVLDPLPQPYSPFFAMTPSLTLLCCRRFDTETVSDDGLLLWAAQRKRGLAAGLAAGLAGGAGRLLEAKATADLLAWLEESEEESDEESDEE